MLFNCNSLTPILLNYIFWITDSSLYSLFFFLFYRFYLFLISIVFLNYCIFLYSLFSLFFLFLFYMSTKTVSRSNNFFHLLFILINIFITIIITFILIIIAKLINNITISRIIFGVKREKNKWFSIFKYNILKIIIIIIININSFESLFSLVSS